MFCQLQQGKLGPAELAALIDEQHARQCARMRDSGCAQARIRRRDR